MVRKRPHQLVESFKATLEEAKVANFLLHVLDVTHPKVDEHYRVTNEVLSELEALDKPTIIVLNKIDQEFDPFIAAKFKEVNPDTLLVSTHTGQGLEQLLNLMAERFILPMRRLQVRIPASRFDLVSLAHREGEVIEERHEAEGVWMDVDIPERFYNQFILFADRS